MTGAFDDLERRVWNSVCQDSRIGHRHQRIIVAGDHQRLVGNAREKVPAGPADDAEQLHRVSVGGGRVRTARRDHSLSNGLVARGHSAERCSRRAIEEAR